jgi:hypothetical protein
MKIVVHSTALQGKAQVFGIFAMTDYFKWWGKPPPTEMDLELSQG